MTKQEKKMIQAYLDKVRKHIGDRTHAEQSDLIRQLEEHIHESISASPGMPVEELIATLDPPESFGEPGDDTGRAPRVLGRLSLGQLSLVVMVTGVVTPFVLMALSHLIRGTIGSIINVGLPLGLVLVVVALGMGIVARKEPAGRATIIACAVILAGVTVLLPVNRVTSGRREPVESIMRIEVEGPEESGQ